MARAPPEKVSALFLCAARGSGFRWRRVFEWPGSWWGGCVSCRHGAVASTLTHRRYFPALSRKVRHLMSFETHALTYSVF